MSALDRLSHKQFIDALFKDVPLKYKKYKKGFSEETWITGKYFSRNVQDFMTQEALLELGVNSKLGQIAIKHCMKELIDNNVIKKKINSTFNLELRSSSSIPSNQSIRTPSNQLIMKTPETENNDTPARKMKVVQKDNTRSASASISPKYNLMPDNARIHAKIIIKYVGQNLNSKGFVVGGYLARYSRDLKFNYEKEGYTKYGKFLSSIDELRVVKVPSGTRVYLTEDFKGLPAIQNLSKAMAKIFGNKAILTFDDFEAMLMEDDAFFQMQDFIPNLPVKLITSFMTEYKTFGYDKTQMIQNVNARLRITIQNVGKRANIKSMKDFLKKDGFQAGRISFRRGGICSVQLTPPSDCFRAIQLYDNQVLEGISLLPVRCTMPDILDNMRDKSSPLGKSSSLGDRSTDSSSPIMGDEIKPRILTTNKTLFAAEKGLKMTDDPSVNEITIQPDTSRMLFMNKIPKYCTSAELIEELQTQDLIVQNEIIIRRGYINPVILETEEQCQRALEEDVIVKGVKLHVEKVKPRPSPSKSRNAVELIEHEDMGLEKRPARNKTQNRDDKVANMTEEYMMVEKEDMVENVYSEEENVGGNLDTEEDYMAENVDSEEEKVVNNLDTSAVEEEEETEEEYEEEETEEEYEDEEEADEEDKKEEEIAMSPPGLVPRCSEAAMELYFECNQRVEAYYDDTWTLATIVDCDEDFENYDVQFEENDLRLLLPAHCVREIPEVRE